MRFIAAAALVTLVTDNDELERTDFDVAMRSLRLDGWQVAEGPAPIRPSIADLDRFDLLGYKLWRSIQ